MAAAAPAAFPPDLNKTINFDRADEEMIKFDSDCKTERILDITKVALIAIGVVGGTVALIYGGQALLDNFFGGPKDYAFVLVILVAGATIGGIVYVRKCKPFGWESLEDKQKQHLHDLYGQLVANMSRAELVTFFEKYRNRLTNHEHFFLFIEKLTKNEIDLHDENKAHFVNSFKAELKANFNSSNQELLTYMRA